MAPFFIASIWRIWANYKQYKKPSPLFTVMVVTIDSIFALTAIIFSMPCWRRTRDLHFAFKTAGDAPYVLQPWNHFYRLCWLFNIGIYFLLFSLHSYVSYSKTIPYFESAYQLNEHLREDPSSYPDTTIWRKKQFKLSHRVCVYLLVQIIL